VNLKRFLASLALLVCLAPRWAAAHKPSDSYLTVRVTDAHVDLRWDVALRDLDYAIGLDANGDDQITWGELRAREADVARYLRDHLVIEADGAPCPLEPRDLAVTPHSDGAYAVVPLTARCPGTAEPRALTLRYSLLFDLDPQHRGLVRIESRGQHRTAILTTRERSYVAQLAELHPLAQFVAFVRAGVAHIGSGIDHLLFLLALLLPSVLRRTPNGTWQAAEAFRPALGDVLKIVTAFTVAHSITLSLAALGIVHLPSRFVESAIAASVVIAALNNLWPILYDQRWTVAFALGLLHGFGFSGTLMDLGLADTNLVSALFGFNVGVELGQFAIVALFVPFAFFLRRSWVYRRLTLVGGSWSIVIVATIWLVERMFAIRL
jgi:hypothetical protein